MNSYLKKFKVTLILLAILAFSIVVSLPNVHSETLTVPQRALAFMNNVVGLDMAKYTVQMGTLNFSATTDVARVEVVKYNLTASGSNLDVVFIFRNNTLVWCKLYPIKDSPIYTQTASNALSAANTVLDKYENYAQKSSHISPLKNMLNSAGQLRNTTNQAANIVQQVSTVGSNASIKWAYTVNGITDNLKVVSLTLQNGGLMFFQDNWNYFTIGNADVNFPKAAAIQLAKQRAQSLSYVTLNNETAYYTILDKPEMATLSMQDRGNGTLYPLWDILLPLDRVYPDMVTSIHVLEWADTGQISFIAPIGPGGPPSNGQDPVTASSPTSPTPATTEFTIATVATLLAATSAIACYLFLKKRRQHP